MRPDRDIRRPGAGSTLSWIAAEPRGEWEAWSAADSDSARAACWMPDRAEELAAPESLDEPERAAREGWSISRGSNGAERLWIRWGAISLSAARDRGAPDAGGALRAGPCAVAAGSIATSGWGSAGEAARLTRPERGAAAPGTPREAFRSSAGAGGDVTGIALAWWPEPGSRPGSRSIGARLVAGSLRRAKGEAAAGEVEASLGSGLSGSARFLLTRRRGAGESRGVAGLRLGRTARSDRGETRIAVDAAGSASGGLDLGLEAFHREGAFRSGARWTRRASAERPGRLDLEASWSESSRGARVRWRAWSATGSARSRGDDGAAELDLRAGRGSPGSWRLRIGSTPRQPRGTGGERTALAEIVAARERGRALRLTGAVRAGQAGSEWRVGRMLGGSLRFERARRASLDLSLEAVRVERNAGVPGRSFEVSSGGAIRTRSRNGIRIAARAWLQRGAWRLGSALDDEEAGDDTIAGGRAARARLWLTWNGDAGSP